VTRGDTLLKELQQQLAGSYTIHRELSGGGMSRVFEAQEIALGRRVVIKVLRGEIGLALSSERFRREIQVAAQLRHPHIVPLFSAGQAGELSYYTMPFIEGESLQDRLARRGRLPVAEAVALARSVAGALEHAHRHGVIHRDINPDNILLDQGHAVVTDFGIAIALSEAAGAASLTATGMIVGTPLYMSPEQAGGDRDVDHRSDIYALGCVLYEMLTGQPPFVGPSVSSLIMQRLAAEPPMLRALCPEADERLELVVRHALARRPDDRFGSAALFEAALADAVGAGPRTTAQIDSGPRRAAVTQPRTVVRRTSSGKTRQIQSLAVLPFANLSGDDEADYLSDGVTESLINKLSRLSGLRVTARSVAFRYKGRDIDPVATGRELKVRAVLAGRVLKRGDRLSVHAELVEIAKAAQLWGEQYNRPLADIFVVQEAIASEISAALRVHISGEERASLAKRYTENTAAYEDYLKGRFYWNKRTADGFRKAQENFQRAIDRDPNYALAHAGIADTYNVLGYYNIRPPRESYPRAKAAAARALDIDASLAEAHASLGYARLFYDRDWEGAETAFATAIEVNPAYPSAHQWRAWYLLVVERFDEMVAELARAHELDPLSLVINDHLGYGLFLAGRTEEAIAQIMRTRELDPSYPLTYWRLGFVHSSQGRYAEAAREYEQAVELTGGLLAQGCLAQAYAAAGRTDDARAVLAALEAAAAHRFVSPLELALAHAGLHQVDEVFTALDRAVEERISDLVRLKRLYWPADVREDPRFAALLRTLGLPTETP
jgi:serine/threonine protein kinase/tetratricopeptide (TPR) repeat protein